MGVKYTAEDIADSIIRQVEQDKRRSPFLKLVPLPPRYDRVHLPLEARPRESWETTLRTNALQWAGYWGISFSYAAVLFVCALAIASVLHARPAAMAVIAVAFMAGIVLCILKICIWVGRANNKAMGRKWRERMTHEAEERLARDDPERQW